MSRTSRLRAAQYFAPITWPFWAIHMGAVAGVVVLGLSWGGAAVALAGYYARMFFVTGGYHRYFAHRTYKTSRWFQFVLGLGCTLTVQKGPLWWAAHHRHHHKTSDLPDDIHSPREGFWWSHIGWILSREYDDTRTDLIRDMARYPELRWLDRYHLIPPIALMVLLTVFGGPTWLLWGFLVPTALAWHGTFTINSLSHVFGSVRYDTGDDSRNNLLLAIITMGEGWHNNHHHYQRAANQGFFWYEIDLTYYVLRALSAIGVVWDVHRAPDHIVAGVPKHVTAARPGRQTAAGDVQRAA